MKVVIDTNVLLIAIPKTSKYRPIFDALIQSKFRMVVSTAIVEEYVEIIGTKTNSRIAHNVGELLMQLENVEKTDVYFRWNLITSDPDDNKFVDCAVSGGVEAIVTNDKHFNELKTIDFPPIEVIDADTFLAQVLQL